MDHFLRLPDSLFENILARLDDIPQLVSLRGLSRRWRRVILSPEFAALFNAQQHQIDYQWLVTLLFTEDRPNLGALMCIEQSHARRYAEIPMSLVFQGYVGDLSLLSVDGSLVLFKYVANGITSLKVLNLFSMVVQDVHVPVPAPMEDDYDLNFNRMEHIRFQSLLDGGVITFNISTVVIGNWDLIPRHCLYVSSQEDWAIVDARPLEDDENFPEFDQTIGMMLLADDEAFKVCLQLGEAVFTRQEVLDLLDPFIQGLVEDFGPVAAGWDVATHLVPGRDGLVVQYQVVTNPYLLGLGRLHGIRFFQISPQWEAYNHIASVPPHLIHGDLLDYTHGVFIEETNGTINITFVANDGDTGFCMLQYLYTTGIGVRGLFILVISSVQRIRFSPPVLPLATFRCRGAESRINRGLLIL